LLENIGKGIRRGSSYSRLDARSPGVIVGASKFGKIKSIGHIDASLKSRAHSLNKVSQLLLDTHLKFKQSESNFSRKVSPF